MSHLGEKDFGNRLDKIQSQKDLIQKGLYGGLPDDEIRKGGKGEGSKGGKVIGHTKSGKPIYETGDFKKNYKDFTLKDHREAGALHYDIARKSKGGIQSHHDIQATNHSAFAEHLENKETASEKPVYDNHGDMAEFHEGQVKYANEKQVKFHEKLKQHHEYGRSLTAKEHEAAAKYHEEISDSDKEVAKDEGVEYEKTIHDDVVDYHKAYAKYLKEKESKGNVEKAMTAAGGEHVTSKESVEHGPKDMQNPKPSDLAKAFEILGLDEDICKAEGSRGGKVIGHTKSGKPIYQGQHESHKSFSKEEHLDAVKVNRNKESETSGYNSKKVYKQEAEYHQGEADNFVESKKDNDNENKHKVGDKVKASDLKKAYEVLGLGDLIEKAEGARGGKVIGHTKSGKPVYANKEASTYTDFSSKDHKDAAELHNERMNHHDRMAQKYSDESKSSAEEASQQRLERHDVHQRNHETAAKESEARVAAKASEASDNKREMSNKENSK